MADNVPEGYTKDNICDEIIDLLITQYEDMYRQLKAHLQKSLQSYQVLVIDLAKGKEMKSGIDFYVGTVRIFLQHPFLLMKARKNANPEKGTTGPVFVMEKHYILEMDSYLNSDLLKLRFTFNGIDFYCPFLPEHIRNLYHEGVPVLWDIQMAYEDISEIKECLLQCKSINAGIHSIKLHLQAAVAIAKTTKVACGSSDPSVTDQPGPRMDPLATGTVTCKQKKAEVFDLAGIPYKQPKQGQLPAVSIAEHIAQMDVAGEVAGVTEPAVKEMTSGPSQPQPQLAEQEEGEEEEEDFVIIKQPETELHHTQCVCREEFDDREQLKNHKGSHAL